MRDIYQELARLEIQFEKHEHPPVFTVEEADVQYADLKGARTKNLFLRNKKGDRHYLLVVESHRRVDLKEIRLLLEESSLSFGSPERLEKFLGLTPGSVSPFGIINDRDCAVVVVVDDGLLRHGYQNFHPNINTATLTLTTRDFQKFLETSGHEVRYLEFPQ